MAEQPVGRLPASEAVRLDAVPSLTVDVHSCSNKLLVLFFVIVKQLILLCK